MMSAEGVDTTAIRVDPDTGASERAEFIELGGDPVYAIHHLPASGTARAVVIVCSPFYAEFPRNYRREVLLGRHLSNHGVAVTRFHHRGVGNSAGDSAAMRFSSVVEDARRVAEVAVAHSGATSVSYHGTRLSALTAGGAAARDKASVSLWDPTVRAAKYFNEVFRTRMVQAVHDGERDLTAGSLRTQLTQGHPIDVLGHSLYPEFYTSMHDLELGEVLGPDPRDLLVIHFGRERNIVSRLIEHLDELGSTVESGVAGESEAWWIANRRADYFVAEERRTLTTELLGASLEWTRKLGWAS